MDNFTFYSPVYVVLGIEFSVLLGKHVSPKLLHTVYKVLETLMCVFFIEDELIRKCGGISTAHGSTLT